ncbi:MAG TPA: ATP-binding protein [Rubricoccaceae bacterium]|nr:ATP-binding protein [Rubricoccaceae bacterium]
MPPLLRRLRLFWTRYLVPASLERDPLFRATMAGLTHRGLRLAGALGVAAIALYLLSHLAAGHDVTWGYVPGRDPRGYVVLWDKVLIGGLGVLLLVVARLRPDVRPGRLVMGLFLLVAAWSLVLDDAARADFTFTAGWLALVMLVTVGTVPFQPWQTGLLCLGCIGLYGLYAVPSPPGAQAPGVPVSRLIFLGLVAFLCTSMSASLYLSRYEQYRALRRAALLQGRLSARGRALEQSLAHVQAMQAQLVQAEKLASLGQLTAGIAHEIKNPLNFVNNFAQLSRDLVRELQEELDAAPERSVGEAMADAAGLFDDLRTNAEKIAEHGRRADGIIRSMLAHSRATPGEKQPTDLNRLLDEYVGLAYHGMRARYAGFNADIERALDPAVGAVSLIPGEIGRVFLNLLDNAFDAVRMRAAAEGGAGYAPTVRVETRREPGAVVVRIADNGMGIPRAVRARVFEPFFTTKPSGEGTGLGLSLAYEIVTAGHGGTIGVETEEGRGTTFTVTLPDTPAPEASGTTVAGVVGTSAGGA